MFKKLRNEKYGGLLIYVTAAICISITFYMLISNIGNVLEFLDKIFGVLSPLIYGFIIAYLLVPFLRFCENKILRFKKGSTAEKKLKRPLAVLMSMIFFSLVVALFMGLIVPQVIRSCMDLEAKISDYITAAQNLVDKLVREFPLFNRQYDNLAEFLDINEISTDLKSFISNFYHLLETAANYLIAYAGRFVIEVKNALIGIMLSVYFLLSKERLSAKLKRLLASLLERKHYLNLISLVRFTDKTVGGFIVGKLIDSVIIGILTFIIMVVFGMPFSPLISVIIGVTNIIPFFGPFIGGIIGAFIIFIAKPSLTLWFLLLVLGIQQLDGNIIGPKILGISTGLTSLAVLISITITSGLFGVSGMFLGVPASAVICALIRQKTDIRLRKKHLETDLEFYYTDPPLRDPDGPIFTDADDDDSK